MTTIAALCEIMPPPADRSESTGSWDEVEARLGTRLPQDYKEFIATYGSGNIGSMPVTVNSPFASEPSWNLMAAAEGIAGAYRLLQEGGYEMAYQLNPVAGGLLPWGTTGNGDYLHWKTEGDPDDWHVIVWDCGLSEFRAFERMNLVGFLTELVSGRLDLFPRAFFSPTPAFIPWKRICL